MVRATRQGGTGKRKGQPPRFELILPLPPGAIVRVHYRGGGADRRLGGGALNIYSGEDIALHVNPRPKLNALVLNSHIGGGWGGEERPEGYPVQEPDEVHLSVQVQRDGFSIHAEVPGQAGTFDYLFAHRLPDSRPLDRITIDLPDLLTVTVQPEPPAEDGCRRIPRDA